MTKQPPRYWQVDTVGEGNNFGPTTTREDREHFRNYCLYLCTPAESTGDKTYFAEITASGSVAYFPDEGREPMKDELLWHIEDLDDEIARLLALRTVAIRYFRQRNSDSVWAGLDESQLSSVQLRAGEKGAK